MSTAAQPSPDDLLARAAELKADGMSWETVALKVGHPTTTAHPAE